MEFKSLLVSCYFFSLLIAFANSLDPELDGWSWPGFKLIDTLMVFLKYFFENYTSCEDLSLWYFVTYGIGKQWLLRPAQKSSITRSFSACIQYTWKWLNDLTNHLPQTGHWKWNKNHYLCISCACLYNCTNLWEFHFNPYKPSVLFMELWQTVQNQTRCRRSGRLIRFFSVCLQNVLLKFKYSENSLYWNSL